MVGCSDGDDYGADEDDAVGGGDGGVNGSGMGRWCWPMGVSCVLQDVKQHPWPLPADAGSPRSCHNQNVSRHCQIPSGTELHVYTKDTLTLVFDSKLAG